MCWLGFLIIRLFVKLDLNWAPGFAGCMENHSSIESEGQFEGQRAVGWWWSHLRYAYVFTLLLQQLPIFLFESGSCLVISNNVLNLGRWYYLDLYIISSVSLSRIYLFIYLFKDMWKAKSEMSVTSPPNIIKNLYIFSLKVYIFSLLLKEK